MMAHAMVQVRRRGLARRILQGAVLFALTASMPMTWAAGPTAAGGAGAPAGGGGGIQINNVAAGIAAMSQMGNITTITTGSQSTIINYQRLTLGAGETLRFVQPNANSRVLNRVEGASPTRIDGNVWSNGRVYFVNPAGVIFGNGAVIDVNGLYAAAGHMTDANFMAGVNRFTENTGLVRNDGLIRAHEVHLVGGNVANFGMIQTGGGGVVTLTAGKDVFIGETQSPTGEASVLVRVSSDRSASKEGTGVQNSGTIETGKGIISMGAGDMYAAGIYNNGSLRGAAISLKANGNSNITEGVVDASSDTGRGGRIEITGDTVGILGGVVDASGKTGGGSIKIGGDFHGAPGTQAATVTGVSSDAVIRADAIVRGNGGQIAIWADDTTRFYGSVSATGGARGGDGGFIEISGKENLTLAGHIDLSALRGTPGTLLLDPEAVTIEHQNAGSSADDGELSDREILVADGGTSSFTISDLTINSLVNGSTVLIEANDSITLESDVVINITTGNSLTLSTITGDISFNSGVTGASITTTTGNVTVNAGHDILMKASNNDDSYTRITTGTGDITLTAGRDILLDAQSGKTSTAHLTTNGGNVSLSAARDITFEIGGEIASITTNGGDISLRAGRTITLRGSNPTVHSRLSSTSSGAGGAILLSAGDTGLGGGGAVGSVFLGNNVEIVSGGGDITFKGTDVLFNTNNKIIAAGTGTVAFETNNDTNTIGLGGGSGSLTVTNNNLGNIISAGGLRFGKAGSQSGTIAVEEFEVTLAGANVEINSNAGAGTVSIDDNNAIGIAVLGNLTIRAGTGGILVTDATAGDAEVSLSGGTRTLTLVSAGGIGTTTNHFEIADLTGTISVANSGAGVFLEGLGSGGLSFSGLTNSGNATTVISAGNINATGIVSGTNIILNAAGGIGTSGALQVDASAASTLTTAGANSAGNIHITTISALPALTITTALASAQTVTIDKAGAMVIADHLTLASGDALVLHAGTSGTGDLTFSSPVNVTADSITLRAGNGSGTGAVNLTNLTLVGASAAAPATLTIEQDATLQLLSIAGVTTDLTVISHTGNIIIDANQSVKSLSATGATIVVNGDVTVTNDLTFNGNLILEKNVTLTGGGATSDLTVTGSIANGSGGTWSLTTSFGGMTSFGGDIGTVGNEIASLLVQNAGGTVTIGSGSAVAIRTSSNAANVVFNQDVLLNGNLTITTDSPFLVPFDGVTFGGKVDSGATPSSLTVNLGLGTWTTFTKDVGSVSPLTGLTIHGATRLGAGTPVTLAIAGPVDFDGVVALYGNSTITATGTASNVTFRDQLFSEAGAAWKLTVNSAATVNFQSGIGNGGVGTELGNVTVNDTTGTIVLGNGGSFGVNIVGSSTVSGADGKVVFNGVTSLNAATTINADGDVTFNMLLQSATGIGASLAINTTGATLFAGGINSNGVNQLSTLTTNAGGTTTFSGGGTIVTSGAQSFGDKVVLGANTVFIAPSLTFSASPVAIDASTFNLTLISNQMTFNGGVANSVIGTGHLALLPRLTSDNILINAGGGVIANTLVIKASDFAIFSGFASMEIGYAAGTGTITITSPPVFNVPVGFKAGGAGGAIVVSSAITANGSVSLLAGTIALNADITTSGKDILLDGAVTLSGTRTLNSAGTASAAGNITITGAVSGAGLTLNLMADGTVTDGNITTLGTIGGSGALGGLNVSGTSYTIGSGIHTVGNINVGTSQIFLRNTGNDVVITTGGGLFNASGVAIDGDGTGNVNLAISTSASGVTAAAAISLGTVGGGSINQVRNLTLIATDALGNADVTVGNVTLNGGHFSSTGKVFNSTSITTGGGNLTVNHTGAVTFGGATHAGTGTVNVTGVGISNNGLMTGGSVTLQAGTGTVQLLGGISGSGPVSVTGTGITLSAGQTVAGSSVGFDAGTGVVLIGGTVSAGGGGFSSTSSGNFTVSVGGGITTANGVVNVNHGGSLTVGGAINAGTGAVSLVGLGFSNGAGATITGGSITINAGSAAVTIGDDLIGSGPLSIMGVGITQNTGATILAGSATLNGGSGAISLAASVSAGSGFSSTSTGNFTITSTGGITTTNGVVSINHSGSVTLGGAVNAGTGAVSVSGAGLSNGVGATITGGSITLNGNALSVTLNGNVIGSGPVSISGVGITQAAGTTLTGGSASLNGGSGAVLLSGTVNGGAGFTTTSTGIFTLNAGGAINTTNGLVSIVHSGAVTLDGAIAAGTGAVAVSGAGITTGIGGAIGGGSITLNGNSLSVTLNANVIGSGPVTISGNGISLASGTTLAGSAASLNGGTGAVVLSGTVNGGAGFSSTSSGLFTLSVGGAINTTNGIVSIVHGGAVTLNGAIAAGTGAVNVSGAGITTGVGGAIGGGDISLNGNALFVTLNANVIGSGAVTINGNAITQAAGTTLTGGSASLNSGSGAVVLSGTVNGGAGFTSTGVGVFTLNSSGALNTTNGIVNVSHTGSVTLNGAIAAGTGAVSLMGAGFSNGVGATIAGGSVTINGGLNTVSIGAAITAGGPLSITGGNIVQNAAGTITSGSASLNSGAGSVLLFAPVVATNGFSSTGTGQFVLNPGSSITTTDANVSITHSAEVTLSGNISAGGGTVTIGAGGAGALQSAGIITADMLVLTGSGAFTFNQTNVVNNIAANVTGALSFVNGGALNVASMNASSVVLTATTLSGGSITATGSTVTINGTVNFSNPIIAAGDIVINGDATITGNVTSSTGSVTFAGNLSLNANITAGAGISVAGLLELTGAGGTNTLSASGITGINLGSSVSGAHSLLLISNHTAGKMSVGDIGISGDPLTGDIEFRSNAGGLINGVELRGDIFARNVSFKAVNGPRPDVPRVATIVSRDDLVIEATQRITMEKNQKLTALGSLSLTAPTLTLGDLGALGTIIIDAKSLSGAIIFVQRGAATNQGLAQPDQGTDVVSYSMTTLTPNSIAAGFPAAGTTIALRGTVSVVGSLSGQRVNFSSLTASVDIPETSNSIINFVTNGDPKLNGKAPFLPLILTGSLNLLDSLGVNKAVQTITANDLANGNALTGTVKDLVATGITGNSPADGRVIPREEQMLIPEQANAITGALRDILREAGINARDLRIEEIINDLLHLAVYDDVPYELDPQPKDFRVAVNRLPYAPVLPVVDMTRKLLFKQATDESGNPVTENGKPKLVSQADAVARVIGEAWFNYQNYQREKMEEARPQLFRAYLESRPEDAQGQLALSYLNQLRDLLAAIKALGLTPKEFDVSKNVLLAKLRFVETVSEEDFPLMVDGPSSLAGSNTAINIPSPPATAAPETPQTPPAPPATAP